MGDVNPVCTFIRKRNKASLRTRKKSSSSEEEVQIVRKKEKIESNPLIQHTSHFVAKKNKSSSGEESDEDISTSVTFKANHQPTQSGPKDQGATAISEIDTDFNHDAQSLFIQSQKVDKEVKSNQDKVYRGLNNYARYIEQKDTVLGNAASGFNRKGPMRAPAHLRATVRWDYQPDICKDYKETGFCSFGDSCKFLHDRSDYKHGWQIDQEVAEGTYGVEGVDDRYEIKDDEGDDDADDHLPLKCMICRGDYKDPVVTRCKHYFCSACALKRFKKTARCYACTEDTKGTFKIAKDLLARIAAIKAKRKAVSEEEGEEEEAGHPFHHDKDDHPCKTVHEHVHNEHYISSSELEDSSDDDAPSSSKANYPTLTRLEGAQPQAPEYCDSDEESD